MPHAAYLQDVIFEISLQPQRSGTYHLNSLPDIQACGQQAEE